MFFVRCLLTLLGSLAFGTTLFVFGWIFILPPSAEEEANLATSGEEMQEITYQQVRFMALSDTILHPDPRKDTEAGKDFGEIIFHGSMESWDRVDTVLRSALTLQAPTGPSHSSDGKTMTRNVGGAKFVTPR